jgi:hypothetical protein
MAVFKDPTRADYEGYMGYFMKGLGEQFSAQGAETFAGGFAMGMFAQPVMSAPAWSISKGLDLTVNRERAKAAKEERDRLLKQDVDSLNEFFSNKPELNNQIKEIYNFNLIKNSLSTLIKEETIKYYSEEQEWIIKDKKLLVPSKSTLIITIPKLSKETYKKWKSGIPIDDLESDFYNSIATFDILLKVIKQYDLQEKYNIKLVTQEGWLESKKKFNEKNNEKW